MRFKVDKPVLLCLLGGIALARYGLGALVLVWLTCVERRTR